MIEGKAIMRRVEERDDGGGKEEEKKGNQMGQKERSVSGEEMEEGDQ